MPSVAGNAQKASKELFPAIDVVRLFALRIIEGRKNGGVEQLLPLLQKCCAKVVRFCRVGVVDRVREELIIGADFRAESRIIASECGVPLIPLAAL